LRQTQLRTGADICVAVRRKCLFFWQSGAASSTGSRADSHFKTAALVLNDRLATVEKNYAHLRSADGANRMHELLGSTFSRM
jgi:hypothetical protein